jgi:hypothetical protein
MERIANAITAEMDIATNQPTPAREKELEIALGIMLQINPHMHTGNVKQRTLTPYLGGSGT